MINQFKYEWCDNKILRSIETCALFDNSIIHYKSTLVVVKLLFSLRGKACQKHVPTHAKRDI